MNSITGCKQAELKYLGEMMIEYSANFINPSNYHTYKYVFKIYRCPHYPTYILKIFDDREYNHCEENFSHDIQEGKEIDTKIDATSYDPIEVKVILYHIERYFRDNVQGEILSHDSFQKLEHGYMMFFNNYQLTPWVGPRT